MTRMILAAFITLACLLAAGCGEDVPMTISEDVQSSSHAATSKQSSQDELDDQMRQLDLEEYDLVMSPTGIHPSSAIFVENALSWYESRFMARDQKTGLSTLYTSDDLWELERQGIIKSLSLGQGNDGYLESAGCNPGFEQRWLAQKLLPQTNREQTDTTGLQYGGAQYIRLGTAKPGYDIYSGFLISFRSLNNLPQVHNGDDVSVIVLHIVRGGESWYTPVVLKFGNQQEFHGVTLEFNAIEKVSRVKPSGQGVTSETIPAKLVGVFACI